MTVNIFFFFFMWGGNSDRNRSTHQTHVAGESSSRINISHHNRLNKKYYQKKQKIPHSSPNFLLPSLLFLHFFPHKLNASSIPLLLLIFLHAGGEMRILSKGNKHPTCHFKQLASPGLSSGDLVLDHLDRGLFRLRLLRRKQHLVDPLHRNPPVRVYIGIEQIRCALAVAEFHRSVRLLRLHLMRQPERVVTDLSKPPHSIVHALLRLVLGNQVVIHDLLGRPRLRQLVGRQPRHRLVVRRQHSQNISLRHQLPHLRRQRRQIHQNVSHLVVSSIVQQRVNKVLHLAFSVEPPLSAARSRCRSRRDVRPGCHRVVHREHRWRSSGDRSGLFQTHSPRIHLRRALGQHGGDRDQAPAPVEILLYGSGDEQPLNAVDDAVRADDGVGVDDGGEIDLLLGIFGEETDLIIREGLMDLVTARTGPLIGPDLGGEDVEHEEGLEGFEVSRLEEKALELGVEVALEGLIAGGEDGYVVRADGGFEGMEEEGLLHELCEDGVVGVEEGDEDRVGVDLARIGRLG
eukprot:TRINITY_DN180_c0_g1_i2.p1 TRINITY_DN180_c0_g1~~TRINITY_DN180_c0_g1_i2.p1  ORF type:complete len:517 (+),score=37.53 TRINITY_DN180_c0_g1_i2:366-1916(+)